MKEKRPGRIVCSSIDFYPKIGTVQLPDSRILKSPISNSGQNVTAHSEQQISKVSTQKPAKSSE